MGVILLLWYNTYVMRGRIIPLLSLVALFILLFMLNYTNPTNVGAFGVLVFFTMIFIFVYGLVFVIVKVFQKILNPKNFIVSSKTYLYSAVVSFGPIILLLMQSFQSINLLTIALTMLFVFLGCFLVNKRA